MTSRNRVRSKLVCTCVCVVNFLLAASSSCLAYVSPNSSQKPSLSEACRAWHNQISDLIDQHRKATEIDDAKFGEIVRLFYEAQAACSAERFTEGLAAYEAIPIQRVKGLPLR